MYLFILNLFTTKLLRNRSHNQKILSNSALLLQNNYATHTVLSQKNKLKFSGFHFDNETDNFNYVKQFELVKLIDELKRLPKVIDPPFYNDNTQWSREKLNLNAINITKGGLMNDFNFIF